MSDRFIENKSQKYRFIDRFSKEYPKKLQEIKNPPAGIYVKGRLPEENRPVVAIVGSRVCSQYGRLVAEEFGRELAKCGVQIVSGLARGIDGIAQNAACNAGGSSFGVLGCGINVIYPVQNKKIYEAILERGGLISEVSPDAAPLKQHFASRNRIISALADIVLVVEAKEKSGTKITVARALEQGKDIFAVPGRIFDICSAGCNTLISQGAGIANSPGAVIDALRALGFSIKDTCEYITKQDSEGYMQLEALEKRVFNAVDYYPTSIEHIAKITKIPIPELLNIIFHLQMKGLLKEEGSQCYLRLV